MGIYYPLRRVGARVAVTVLCLLVVGGMAPKHLSGGVLKPLFGWGLFTLFNGPPLRTAKEITAGFVFLTGYVRRAIDRAETERASIEAERDAFLNFSDTVRGMDVVSHASFETPTTALVSASPDRKQLQTVRDRYRETVMAVPGYEDEYGESLRENMSAEFGEEVTAAVLDGERFTPQLRDLLVGQASAAARQRERLLETIDSEYESLIDARQRLEAAEVSLEDRDESELAAEPFETLLDLDRRSRRDEARYERLLTDRQRQLHRETRWFRTSDATFFQEYLYRDLDVRFPVLQAALERIERLRERRQALTRAIARRE